MILPTLLARNPVAAGLGVALLVATIALATQTWRLNSERTAHAETRAAWAEQVAAGERAAREATEAARETEQRLRGQLAQTERAAHDRIQIVRRDADAARAAAHSLRDAAAAAAARSGCPAGDSAPAAGGAPVAAGGTVLADVLGELAAVAVGLAEQADRARIAGLACEAAYDALSVPR